MKWPSIILAYLIAFACVSIPVIFLFVLFALITSTKAHGQIMPQLVTNQITQYQTSWEMPFDTNVEGFYFYLGTNKIDVGSNTYFRYCVTGCIPVVAVSSYDISRNESAKVCETNTYIMSMFSLTLNHPCAIGTTNMHDWYPVTNVLVPMNKKQEFFRIIK